MRSLFAIIAALTTTQPLLAQTLSWAGQMARTIPHAVHADGLGNMYTTGQFTGTVDFDPGNGVTNLSAAGSTVGIYVQKLDASGKLVWAKHMEGSVSGDGFDVATDNSTNVYVIGYFQGTVDFDPGSGITNLTSTGPTFNDLFIQKLDANGNLVWVRQIKNVLNSTPSASLAVDGGGNVYCTGTFNATIDFDPGPGDHSVTPTGTYVGYVLKLDVAGNFSWVNTYNNTSGTSSYGIAIATDGNHTYATGFFFETFAPDPDSPTTLFASKGNADAFVLKLTAAGKFALFRQIGGSTNEYGRSVTIDNNGNIFLAGEFLGTCDFNLAGTPKLLTSAGSTDIFLQKLDPSGNLLWVKQIGGTAGDFSENVSVSNTGHVYVGGEFTGTASFKIGATPASYTSSPYTKFILDISPSEEINWVIQYKTYSLFVVAVGENVYVAGHFYVNMDFDPGAETKTMTAASGGSAYVVKFGPPVITGVEDSRSYTFSVYPNPVKSIAIVELEKKDGDEVTILVRDVFNRTVKEHKMNSGTAGEIDMSDLSDGLYIIEMKDSCNKSSMRLIKN